MTTEGIRANKGDFLLSFDATEIQKRLLEEQANLKKAEEEYEKMAASQQIKIDDLHVQLEEARAQRQKTQNRLRVSKEFEASLKMREASFDAEMAAVRVTFLERKLESTKKSSQLQLRVLKDSQKLYQRRIQDNQDALNKLTLLSPIAGVVVFKTNYRNEKKQIGSDVYRSETIMSLPDLSTLEIEGQIAEVDAGKIRIGQEVAITFDALPEKSFRGRIIALDSVFKRASRYRPAKVLGVRISLNKIDEGWMRPGMVARLQVEIHRFSGSLAVPVSAIHREGSRSYVWVRSDGKPEQREVVLGEDNGVVALVTNGLQEGDEVAGRPFSTHLP
jgi:RND family efflux transporter MFP subunit